VGDVALYTASLFAITNKTTATIAVAVHQRAA
jgi:hypothetical protein